ncbi:MAG TPA: crosslink repair DNA glycosylase YcaQ family protein, partial [Candidatus Limnocylindrales bacterium]|nr:crosslink repair DNA glycosylase YcaQ family protein [Candidatus Limnocylindrales bacterium]
MPSIESLRIGRDQVLGYRARVSHLDAKLPPGSFARAAWGGLQDSVPRAGVLSLHARLKDTKPDSWEDPSVVQIWFRGGADYIVPREDAGVFMLGSSPRDPERVAALDRLADDIHRVTEGRTMIVNDVSKLLGHAHQTGLRVSGLTGRVHIRWDASRIWLIPVDRPDIDPEDARRELARRFVHWFGPTTKPAMARWTGVAAGEATETWKAIEFDLVPVDVEGLTERRFMLAADLEALEGADHVSGVRLLPYDDAF